MRTKIVTYQDDNLAVELTVTEATVLVGMRRTRLKLQGDAIEKEDVGKGTYDSDRHLLRVTIYPDLVAATIDAHGLPSWPLAFEDFLNLPEALWVQWEDAVYDLNPHWLPSEAKTPEEKKANLPISGVN